MDVRDKKSLKMKKEERQFSKETGEKVDQSTCGESSLLLDEENSCSAVTDRGSKGALSCK